MPPAMSSVWVCAFFLLLALVAASTSQQQVNLAAPTGYQHLNSAALTGHQRVNSAALTGHQHVNSAAPTGHQRVNTTASKTSPSNRIFAKQARSEFPHHGGYEHHFPHHYGGGHYGGVGHYKEFEHYLLPMLVVLGLGVLFMPILSVLMTSMVGNVPVTTLVSGRKKREVPLKPLPDKTVTELWQRISRAIDSFSEDIKEE